MPQRGEQTNQAKPSRKNSGGTETLRNLCVCSKQMQLLPPLREEEGLFVSLNAPGEAAASAEPEQSLEP